MTRGEYSATPSIDAKKLRANMFTPNNQVYIKTPTKSATPKPSRETSVKRKPWQIIDLSSLYCTPNAIAIATKNYSNSNSNQFRIRRQNDTLTSKTIN